MQQISNINPAAAVFTLIMAILFIVLPRKYAALPLLMTTLYLPLGQVVMISSLHFTMFRVMVLVGFARIAMRREHKDVKLNKIDKFFMLYVVSNLIIYTIQWKTSTSFIYISGHTYNAIGAYFLFRFLIKDYDDCRILMKMMAIIIVPVAFAVLTEMSTGRNFFSIFGGVREFSEIRDGRVRCQASFAHPILAGMFGATTMPLFLSFWCKDSLGNKNAITGIVGFSAATIIAMGATSSGALMSYGFAIIALLIWFYRDHMRAIRWGVFISLLIMHMLMKAPVWFLMARIADILGGSGWHRAQIVDAAVNHFDEWWLLGTRKTVHWTGQGFLDNPDAADITNHFVGVGITGGVISLIFFVLVIVYCFQRLGVSLQLVKDATTSVKMALWTLGVALFAHIISFMSVSYYDQISVFYFMLLAVIASITTSNSLSTNSINDNLIQDTKATA
ncbi:MAG: hypothetical protein ABFD08_12665 [Syntrophomonas sp.]